MPQHVRQRPYWNGDPERSSDAFRLTKQKGDRTIAAVCEVWSHQLGWELKLMIDGRGLHLSSVARTASDIQTIVDEWRSEMLRAGWKAFSSLPTTEPGDDMTPAERYARAIQTRDELIRSQR